MTAKAHFLLDSFYGYSTSIALQTPYLHLRRAKRTVAVRERSNDRATSVDAVPATPISTRKEDRGTFRLSAKQLGGGTSTNGCYSCLPVPEGKIEVSKNLPYP